MPVVMLTSRSSPFDRARGMLAGCDSYLTKPITWDEFRTALDRALLKSVRNDRSKLTARGYTTGTQRA
jgi:two-component system cell cycle response regulator